MYIKTLNNIKLVFVGDINSINLEIISKSHSYLANKKIKYVLLGNINEITNYFKKINFHQDFIEVFSLDDLKYIKNSKICIFDLDTDLPNKSKNIINQLKISNNLSKVFSSNLVTMPINKSIIKKKYDFNGVTEFLENINNKKTYMLMRGENFSIIPITTHIKFKDVLKYFNKNKFYNDLNEIISILNQNKLKLKYNEIIILGINPHAGEKGTLGNEEIVIQKIIKKIQYKTKLKITGPLPADSAFKKINKKQLFISFYHDQALIPFKILNKFSINNTIGLSFNRFSPSHGTAENIIFKNKADNTSYLECMLS